MKADLKPLEFSAVCRIIESHASSPYGADAARNLSPAPSLEIARNMQESITAGRKIHEDGLFAVIPNLPDIRAALRQASSPGASLSSQALFNIQTVMRAAVKLYEKIAGYAAIYPGDLDTVLPPQELMDEMDALLVGSGSLREDASPELVELFSERNRLREQAEEKVKQVMAQDELKDVLDNVYKVEWDSERAVIIVRSVDCQKVKGVRRGSRMGGRDAIVEPIQVVPTNNQLENVNGKITSEQQRLLRHITLRVNDYNEKLNTMIGVITWVDLAMAAGKLSQNWGAHAPHLVDDAVVELKQAYHPLLLSEYSEGRGPTPVPLSIRLDNENNILLVTGPNTGGKTVALKTLGLLVAMSWCGLHIPAEEECTIGNYARVIVDVGDHQSLFHHLSTFAGHVEVLKRILDEADKDTLVLLDELGTGTDPEEGAALAMAVLDELLSRNAQGIVNTHLSPLKDYAEDKSGLRNASMQFDEHTLSPTYQLLIGQPGVSLGLTIAEKNGLASDLVAQAREHLERIKQA